LDAEIRAEIGDDRMTRGTTAKPDLVVASTFVQAARDSGYVSLATALGELIDNSIQASATKIDLCVSRPDPVAGPTVTVADNGRGMTRAELAACLKFGGTSRFNDRQSIGRYGMGLPGASLSQTRNVIVESWQSGETSLAVHLNVEEAVTGDLMGLRPRKIADAPRGVETSGCRVTWTDCDRIEYQRLGWLERSLAADLGRMFRRFINAGVVLTLNGRRIRCRDPLHLDAEHEGHSAAVPFEPMQYEMIGADGEPSIISMRFSELPVRHWHQLDSLTKRRLGIVGHAGVSVLRAGREIAYGWHLMGGKRKENYDDWWRCEIEFEPSLDEKFGITHSKQGIRPTSELREALEPDLESMARLLNARVRQAFEAVKFESAADRSCRLAAEADPELPVIPALRRRRRQAAPLAYRLETAVLEDSRLVHVKTQDNVVSVTINTEHPGYEALYQPLAAMASADSEGMRLAVELLLLALARSELVLSSSRTEFSEQHAQLWSETYAKMLRRA